jgi:hypothetical protein
MFSNGSDNNNANKIKNKKVVVNLICIYLHISVILWLDDVVVFAEISYSLRVAILVGMLVKIVNYDSGVAGTSSIT